ncbi:MULTISPECIES: amidase domain-containing protein [Actinoplanes]|uniref:amidase domain-containing protein n=1 Tax=Actinoplanes TaxID=1865 RepID=UPI000A66DCE8|nr:MULTISPECIES: amidase domain-containing protein [Actinoplanes]GLY04083.1 hypothetical protein Acsp01_44620 [Actinoplanes sp. NBRC 101535]
MATIGLSVVSPGAAGAVPPDCAEFATTTNGNGSALMLDTYPLKTGPYGDCAKTSTDGVKAGTRLYFWCYTMNSYDNKWWYARVDGTTDYGWIYETHLTSVNLSSDADTSTPVKECVFTGQPAVGARSSVPATTCVTSGSGPVLATTRPSFSAVVTDPQGDPARAEFEWWTADGATLVGGGISATVASGGTGSVTVPAGALANGTGYSWRARATDGATLWSPWSGLCRFTVDTGVTAAATATSATYPRDTWSGAAGTAGTFTLSPPPGQTATAYLYALNNTSPTSKVAAAADGTATVTLTPGRGGMNRLYVRAFDAAGNLTSALGYHQFGVGRGAEDVAEQPDRAMTAAETTAMATLEPLALTFLKNRAAAITGENPSGTVPLWTGMAAQEATGAGELAQARAALAADGLSYVSSTVTVDEGMVQLSGSGNEAYYWTVESAALTPAAGSDEPANEYQANRVFVFVRDGSAYKLADESLTYGAHLPPVTEPAGRISTVIPPSVEEATAATDDEALYDSDPSESYNAADGMIYPDAVQATVAGSDPVGTVEKVDDTTAEGTFSAQAIPKGLCYSCIVKYARKYAKNRNKDYRDFTKKGGDCTNFVSQALRAGGWKNDTGWYRSDKNWWYNWANQTYTWTSAERWSRFAPRRTKALTNVWQLSLADVLQVDFNRDGRIDHTTIVTKVTKKEIYLSYHTNNTLDKPLSSFLKAYPNGWFYAYRT